MNPEVAQARARCAGLHGRPQNDPDRVAARRDLAAAKAFAHITRILDAAPPLTDEQSHRIAALLLAGGDAG